MDNEQITEEPMTEEASMGDAYDRAMGNVEEMERPRDDKGRFTSKDTEETEEVTEEPALEVAEEVEEVAEATEEPEATEETTTEVRSPNYLPSAVREVWADIPEAAQEAIARSQQEMSAKLSNMGRQQQALNPILSEIQRAAQQFPELSQMTPDQVAKDVFELAHTRANLRRDPVNTLLQVAQETGSLQQLYQRLGLQPQESNVETIQMQQEIASLKSQLQQQQNPVNVEAMVQEQIAARDAQQEVIGFAQGKEHWAIVEGDMPALIPAARHLLGDVASNADVLSAAYDMAIDAKGLRASPKPAPQAAPAQADPKRTKAAIKAKSVNVKSSPSKSAPVSERDAMGAAYDKMMASR